MADYDYFDYFDAHTGEGLDDDALHERFDDFLDEFGDVELLGALAYSQSYLLKEVDPIAYRVTFNEWLDGEVQAGVITEDEGEDTEGEEDEDY